MKKSEKLNEAIGNIDDNMIDTAYKRSSAKGRRSGLFEIIGSAAAVIAIAIFAVVLSQYAKKDGNIAATTTDVGDVTSVSDYEVEAGVCKRGQIWGDYIFRYTEQDGLKKYNIHTGERSDAVPVSLADNSWAAIGNTFYLVSKDYDANRSTITAYDVVTGETNVVYETSGILNAYDGYEERILLRYTPGVRANYDYHYFWFDTKTGETEELDGRYLDGYTFSEFIDDRIVWQNMDESYKGDELGRYYSTDLKGKDFKKYNFDYYYGNHYRFALEEDENGAKHYNMYVTLANETEEKLLIADLDFPLFTENKIIYTKTVPEAERQVAYADESGKKRMNQSGGDVYVMDPDGSNDHLLFHTDECISAMNDTINYRRWYVGKDYAAIFSEYELPERGLLERVIIFNINTGEFVVEHEAENSEKIVFMTPQEVEDVTKIHVSSLPEGYDYSFSGEEVKPITDYLVSLHPVSIDDNDGYMDGMTWVIELTYVDGTVKEIYHMGTEIRKSGDGKKYYKLSYEEGRKFDTIVWGSKNSAKTLPADFSFSLVWDTYGISSYDSKTGKLIKTKDTTNISKYTTTYKMSKEELSRIYNILFSRIDINSYPDEYDPYNAPDAEIRLVSKPSQTVIISVTANGRTKTVTCSDISFGSEGYDDKATAFLKAKKDIVDILTNTDEWQALPDYEVFYD